MKRRDAAIGVLTLLLLTGCASGPGADGSEAAPEEPLTVFAAASLQGAFDRLADAFEDAHPEFAVAPIRYDGSQALATQIVDGADVDVIAFANEASLEPVTDAGRSDAGEIFATNTLRIAVAPGNPRRIDDLADLADPDLAVVLCAPEVPCGAAARTLLENAGVTVTPVSEESSVAAVATRISLGEADAGLVYATDIRHADRALDAIAPAGAGAVVNRYPIAVADRAPSPTAARAFVDFVLSDAGQDILDSFGFGAP